MVVNNNVNSHSRNNLLPTYNSFIINNKSKNNIKDLSFDKNFGYKEQLSGRSPVPQFSQIELLPGAAKINKSRNKEFLAKNSLFSSEIINTGIGNIPSKMMRTHFTRGDTGSNFNKTNKIVTKSGSVPKNNNIGNMHVTLGTNVPRLDSQNNFSSKPSIKGNQSI